MALNITFDGFAYKDDGSLSSADVAYQAYFYKANSGSSNSAWNNTRIVENTGYWNINLGDGDFLTQDGSAASGDVVIVVFWSPTTSDRLDVCSQLTEWGCFRIVLDGSSTYTNPTQVKANICPDLNFSLPITGLIGQNITCNNTSSDTHQWTVSGTTMYQRDSWYTSLMGINDVDNSTYDWGDLTIDNVTGTTNGSHQYSATGTYDFEIVIEDECGCTVTGTDSIIITGNPPVPNIIMIPPNPDPNEAVSFQYSGTDPDTNIVSIDWIIEDDGTYGTTNTTTSGARDDVIPHSEGQGTQWHGVTPQSGAFTNPGNHTVSIVVNWWDGFNMQTVNYSEVFNQRVFTGPTPNFNQVADAELNSPVTFENTTSDPESRVGTGLPDHFEYSWVWTDGTSSEVEADKPYSYDLVKTPTTAVCTVELCGQWSNGWETTSTCTEKEVVFETTVTVTPEDCYYNLNIIGTSTDGSVTGYGWTVYSGTSVSGSWTETWSSPVGLDQNDKKICFTSEGWYKIEGTVYGTGAPTSDDETLYVSVVCPPTEALYNIWNGTGVQDVGSDWDHSGSGTETAASKHTGTNGLDATGLSKNNKVRFRATGDVSVYARDYDFLRFWINLKSWPSGGNKLKVRFKTTTGSNSDFLYVDSYLSNTDTGSWQKVMIPITDFFTDPAARKLKELEFRANSNIGFWLDDVDLSMGTYERDVIAVCAPTMTSNYSETKTMKVTDIRPNMKGRMSVQPSARIIHDGLRPFPGPTVT
jgi:hypothetical protein